MEEKQIPLEDYLRQIYPLASDAEISQYLEWIETYQADKLPKTPAMVEYDEVDLRIKKDEARKEELKAEIIKQKSRINHSFDGINISEITTRTYRGDVMYDWVASITSPEILEQLTVKTIDTKLFKQFEAKHIIEYDELPEELFTESKSWRLQVQRPRNKK